MSQIMMPSTGGMGDIRNTLMTMFMVKNVHGSTGSDIYGTIYMMIVTSVIDMIMKYFPVIISFFQQKYTSKMSDKISSMTTDLMDNTLKKKMGSVIMEIVVNDASNITSQAILDHITNHKNTVFVSYKKQNYMLNQKDVISLEDDYYACMLDNSQQDSENKQSEVQKIEIYSFIHNTTEIRKFLDKLTYNYSLTMKNKLGNQRYFFNMTPYDTPVTMETSTTGITKTKNLSKLPPVFEFIMKPFQTNRAFSNLFGEKMDTIRERVKFFINNKRWYDEKGIPYTLGILLSGPPGTGKTSTIKCIANETNRHIFNINLNHDITKKQLENLFFNENVMVSSQGQNGRTVSGQVCIPLEQRLYVLEDIDCQSNLVLDRSLEQEGPPVSPDAVDLSFLLNLLDGVLENPGRIVIMTSNYPERLDRALIRPGRIDVIAKFDYCSHKTMIDMIEFFYDKKMTNEEKDSIRNINEFSITPAEMSKIMFENFGDYPNMFNQLDERLNVKTDEVEGITFLPDVIEYVEEKCFITKVVEDNMIDPTELFEWDRQSNREEQIIKNVPKDNNIPSFTFIEQSTEKASKDYENRYNEERNKYIEEVKKYKELPIVGDYGKYLNDTGIDTVDNSMSTNWYTTSNQEVLAS